MNRTLDGYDLLVSWSLEGARYVPKIEVSRAGARISVCLFKAFPCHSWEAALAQANDVARQVTAVTDDGALSFR